MTAKFFAVNIQRLSSILLLLDYQSPILPSSLMIIMLVLQSYAYTTMLSLCSADQPGVLQVVPNMKLQLHSGPGRLH